MWKYVHILTEKVADAPSTILLVAPMELTTAEVHQLAYLTLDAQDRAFEFWISASLGVLIAVFFVGAKIAKRFLALIFVVYALFAVSIIVRWVLIGLRREHWYFVLVERGEYLAPGYWAGVSVWLTVLIFFVGTCGTLYFLWYTGKRGK